MSSETSPTSPPEIISTTTVKPSSFFAGASLMRGGLNEVASTPPPTPPPPPPDPLDYEKSTYKDRVGENDLVKLKEQVRILKGLPLTEDKDKARRKIDRTKPPKVCPKGTFTSSKRKELQQHRMLVRCANLKDKYKEYESKIKHADAGKIFRQLRSESMAKTAEQVDHEFDMEELENLKNLANKAKEQEVVNFKETIGSKLRYKFIRGQPIISANFRNSYDDYFKPPFAVCKDIYRPKVYQLPKIDKKHEIWYVPVDDEEGVPLHRQMKSPEPKNKRGMKERGRPPLKMFRKVGSSVFKASKDNSKATTKRPPWGVYRGFPLNVGG